MSGLLSAARPRSRAAGLAGIYLGFLAACGGGEKPRTVLDAAALYAAHSAVFDSIRGAYPGPYREFTRLPARDPAAETQDAKAFIKALRRTVPIDYVDFFPLGEGLGDELDVVLNRYADGDAYHTISLIYFSTPMTLSEDAPNMRMFETCDARALDWLENATHDPGPVAVFCRLNEDWSAYQRVD